MPRGSKGEKRPADVMEPPSWSVGIATRDDERLISEAGREAVSSRIRRYHRLPSLSKYFPAMKKIAGTLNAEFVASSVQKIPGVLISGSAGRDFMADW